MELKNSLYRIIQRAESAQGTDFTLQLQADSVIYQAHFPEQPITPGVCIVQIALELLEEVMGKSLEISFVKNVKFLSVISPREVSEVTYQLRKIQEEPTGEIKMQVTVVAGETVYTKLSLTCQEKKA